MMSPTKPKVHKVITMPPEEDRAMAMGNMLKKFCEDQTCGSKI